VETTRKEKPVSNHHRDQALEDAYFDDLYQRARDWVVAEVARRGTTFTALRSEIEQKQASTCDSHGLDFWEYRVRFRETVWHPDVGYIDMAHDFVFDFRDWDKGWVAKQPVAEDPAIAELLECL
jgi:hypothetical protein